MADALDVQEIRDRSLRGAKWLLMTNVVSVPAAYALALLLGRADEEALGAYALAQIVISIIITFVVFGGQVVLRNFMPKIEQPEVRGKLFFSYSLLLAGLLAVSAVIVLRFPQVLTFLLKREIGTRELLMFVAFSLVVVTGELVIGATFGMMHIKVAAIAQAIIPMFPLPFVAALFVLNRSLLVDYPLEIMLALLFGGYLVALILCAVTLLRDKRFKLAVGWYMPRRFLAFCVTTHLATFFTFAYLQVDRIFALDLGNLAGLGMYEAVLKIRHVIDFAPIMLGAALVPMFSSLLATGNQYAVKRAYDLVQRTATTAMILLALPMIAFSRELLALFGPEYVEYDYLLALFSMVGIITSPFMGNTALLTSLEKNTLRLTVSTVQIAIQLSGTFLFLGTYGILAVAGSKMVGSVIAQSAMVLFVLFGLKRGLRMPRTYYAGIGVGLPLTALRIWVLPPDWWSSIGLCVGALLGYWLLSGLTVRELTDLAEMLLRRKRLATAVEAQTPAQPAGDEEAS